MGTHSKRKYRALLPVCILLALGALAAGLWTLRDPFPRVEVAGCRITGEEYLQTMYQARNDVLSDHAAAGISLTDWSRETSLGDPRRLTMERTLERLCEYYAVSLLAVERGYLSDAGYRAMQQDMERINSQRQEALEAGEMVTGLPSFTLNDYLTYRASSLRLQFCNDPENPEYQVAEDEILQRYQADRDNLYRQPDSMELRFLLADGADESLEQEFQAIRQAALQTGDLAAALEAAPALSAWYQEISVTADSYSIYARSHSDVLAWAADLESGELSQVIRQEDRLCLIQCCGRTAQQYAPLEDVKSIVVQSIRESRYDALIAGRMESMEITGDLNALYRFTAEHLP